jgi:hypothetical protein
VRGVLAPKQGAVTVNSGFMSRTVFRIYSGHNGSPYRKKIINAVARRVVRIVRGRRYLIQRILRKPIRKERKYKQGN